MSFVLKNEFDLQLQKRRGRLWPDRFVGQPTPVLTVLYESEDKIEE